jgi:hypothetical protein
MSERGVGEPLRKSDTRASGSVDDVEGLGPRPIQLGVGAKLGDSDEAKGSHALRVPRRGECRAGVEHLAGPRGRD